MKPMQTPVLVVDDSATMRTLVRGMLAQLGYVAIDEAENGRDALAKARAANYGLIVSDWHMEPMNGLDLLRAVRKLSRRVRFIFLTSERTWSHQTTARIDGADGFLTKPFTLEALRAKLRTVFDA